MNSTEWRALEDQALWLLGHGDQASPREGLQGMAPQLRLWHYRYLSRYTSWNIILFARDYRAKPALVREVCWDRTADWKFRAAPTAMLRRRRPLEPSIRIRDAQIAWSDLSPFLEKVGGLQGEPAAEAGLLSGDEDTFGVEGFRSYAHVRIEWAGSPRGLRSTAAWFGKFRNLLIQSIKDREERSDA